MAIAHSVVVDKHDGSIHFETEEGKGTTFIIRLPQGGQGGCRQGGVRVKRILFVDDESKILDGIRRMLHADRERWDMQFAVGGEAALQACEAGSFDVVISDMRMPGMDGATLLGHIRDRFPGHRANCALGIFRSGVIDPRSSHGTPLSVQAMQRSRTASDDRTCVYPAGLVVCAEIRKSLAPIGELPSLSDTYRSLHTSGEPNPNTSIRQVADIIERDMGCRQKSCSWSTALSSAWHRTVTTLQSAASYLGMETIKNLALASETFRSFCTRLAHSAGVLRVHTAARAPYSRHRRRAPRGPRKLGTLR